jgi:hypothetical protein
MGEHTTEAQSTPMEATKRAQIGEPVWDDAAHGAARSLVDPRVPGVKPDLTAFLHMVDDDHHAGTASDPRFSSDDARQNEFQRKRRRDEVMEALRSQHASELHGIPSAYRIEEQVVGSTHRFVVARPRVTNDLTALVMPTIRASGTRSHGFTPRLSAATGFHVLSKDGENEIAVEFAPQQAGPISADLMLEVRWNDGSVDVRTINLQASARLRTEIPEKEIPVSPNAQFEEAAVFGEPSPDPTTPLPSTEQRSTATSEFHRLARDLDKQAENLSKRQIDGVDLASEEAMSYTRKPPETSLFYDLMELAISMGIAGVAGILARRIGANLAARLGKDDKSSLALGLTDAMKEGMKKIGNSAKVKRAVEKLPGGPERHSADEATSTEDVNMDVGSAPKSPSTNGRIAFFAEQTAMLRDLAEANEDLVAEQAKRLMPLLETNPEQALAAMRALKQAFVDAGGSEARDFQAHASSMQWVAAVARSSMGSDTASTHDGSYSRKVSDMTKYGPISDGVLSVDVLKAGDQVVVVGASIKGVSQEIADRIAMNPMRDAPIPIRIKVSGDRSNAVIHLDEAKRMRVYGLIDPDDAMPLTEYVQRQNMPEHFEAQSTMRAEKIVSAVLAKPLGLDRVASDDASGRGDPK